MGLGARCRWGQAFMFFEKLRGLGFLFQVWMLAGRGFSPFLAKVLPSIDDIIQVLPRREAKLLWLKQWRPCYWTHSKDTGGKHGWFMKGCAKCYKNDPIWMENKGVFWMIFILQGLFVKQTRFPKKLVDRQDSGLLLESMFFDDVFLWRTEPQAHWNHSIGPTCPGQLPKSMLLV